MKKSLPLLLALLLSPAALPAAVSVNTTPAGYQTLTLPATGSVAGYVSYLALPLLNAPVWSGPVGGTNAITFSIAGTPWVAKAYVAVGHPYFVKITSGKQAGRFLKITANTNHTLTVDTTDQSAQTTALNATGFAVVAKDTFEIVEGDTLASFLGDGTTANPLCSRAVPAQPWPTPFPSSSRRPAPPSSTTSTRPRTPGCSPPAWSIRTTWSSTRKRCWPSPARRQRQTERHRSGGSAQDRAAEQGPRRRQADHRIHPSCRSMCASPPSPSRAGSSRPRSRPADTVGIWSPTLKAWQIYYQLPNVGNRKGQWRLSGNATTNQSSVLIAAGTGIQITKHASVTGATSYVAEPLQYTP